jgi:hypothetical protein
MSTIMAKVACLSYSEAQKKKQARKSSFLACFNLVAGARFELATFGL